MREGDKARRWQWAAVIVLGVIAGWLVWNISGADAAECSTGTISWADGTPLWSPVDELEAVNVSIEGTFLWVQYRENPADEYDGTVSVELFGEETWAAVCPDVTVTLEYQVPGTPDHLGPEIAVVDLAELWGFDPTIRLMRGVW